ncbi:hypothetical protein DWZ53_09470 [Coprobacillus sp. AF33-1AC]|nr:hypothetical protein DWZ53_09470 [Coprobacillus sp. AF33-1AC]
MYVEKKYNERKSKRYVKANKKFNDAINELEKENYILFLLKGATMPSILFICTIKILFYGTNKCFIINNNRRDL